MKISRLICGEKGIKNKEEILGDIGLMENI